MLPHQVCLQVCFPTKFAQIGTYAYISFCFCSLQLSVCGMTVYTDSSAHKPTPLLCDNSYSSAGLRTSCLDQVSHRGLIQGPLAHGLRV